jgi:hypothetical protein
MTRIKLQCECGQRFAFEVEPVNDRMPSQVMCPACGADSTAAANAFLAQSAEQQGAASVPRSEPIRVSIPAHTHTHARLAAHESTVPRPSARPLPGQVGRSQAKLEAKAKISWGDPPIQVLAYLRSQGYGKEESSAILEELVRERAATIRGKGIANVGTGIVLAIIPLGAWFHFMSVGYIYVKFFGLLVIGGLYGLWLVVKGISMLLAPKSISGDVEE